MIDLIWSLRRAGLCVLMKGGWHLDLAIGAWGKSTGA